jgi:hypothetical protein
MPCQLLLGVDLLPPQVRLDDRRLAAERLFQRVREAVRRVGREDQRPLPGDRACARGRSRNRCLADAALTRVKDRPRRRQRPFPPVVVVPVVVVDVVDVVVVVGVVPVLVVVVVVGVVVTGGAGQLSLQTCSVPVIFV